ncbi:hypothetical protein [Rubinisphaera italica]|nr:hypothetical protein [Rubinisphaera italica]
MFQFNSSNNRVHFPLFLICLFTFSTSVTYADSSSDKAKSLTQVVLKLNEKIESDYSVLEIQPLTITRLRSALQTEIDQIAESDLPERHELVKLLQTMLEEEQVPEDASFGVTKISGSYPKDSPKHGQRWLSINFTLSALTPNGANDYRLVGLTDLLQTYRIIPGEHDKASTEKTAGENFGSEDIKSHRIAQSKKSTGFLDAGVWYNFYFEKENDLLKRGGMTVNAVKLISIDEDHSNWVQIQYPKERDEHLSILKPASMAFENEDLELSLALEEWEKTITEWNIVWVNLDYVVRITKVGDK